MSLTEDPPGQDESDTRQRILQAAASIFGEKGYAGATTRAIAARAGVNEVTLFRHFGRKEHLLSAVIDQHSRLPELIAHLETRLTGDYHQDLVQIADLFFQVLTERREVVRLMLCEADQFPELREALARNPRRLRQVLVGYLEEQMRQQQLRTIPLEAMAQAFWGMLFSTAISSEILEEPILTAVPAERFVSHLVDVFVSGTARPGAENITLGPVQKTLEPAVTVQAVTRRFKDLIAVEDLSFTVARGEIFGLLGPNGAGKTTTINLITGMLVPDRGAVRVLGGDPQREARWVRQRIGLVPQETNLYLDLSAVDNMWHHAALYVAELSGVQERIRDLLTLTNLWERRKDPVRTFSGGMKRRLALARTLLHDPELILFDEPTLGVDVQGKHVLWDHIQSLQGEGKTFVVSTNDMAEAEALCDRLVIIDHGRTIALDTPERLKDQLGRDIITLRTTPSISDPEALLGGLGVHQISRPKPDQLRLEVRDAERIVSEIVARVSTNHCLESILMSRPSLDDVFLHHTGRALRE
jgi:ABC-2 type transport system ATP-binding protein